MGPLRSIRDKLAHEISLYYPQAKRDMEKDTQVVDRLD